MNLNLLNQRVPDGLAVRAHRFVALRGRTVAIAAIGLSGAFGYAGQALAQATSPQGGLGAQMNLMSSEATNAGSLGFAMGCYIAAAVCFFFGVWAAWQSRQPQNRETGYVGRAVAGLVLCGLFASAGVWINKASISASGGGATVNDNPQMVQFGAGG